jgi:two-component system chemotaxis response regulator CheB
VFASLPAGLPLVVLVSQHMPATFTAAFAQRRDRVCPLTVRQARSGELLHPGLALVAPGTG